jgi:cardiolipin synthase (CMP-forming)
MPNLALSSKLLTLPNWITFGRILCVPFVVYTLLTNQPVAALIFFVVAAISDALDGFIARYTKTRSKLGAYLDPLADKLLFLGTFLTLGYLNIIPLWLIILSIYRDLTIVLGVGLLKYYKVDIEIKPLLISKINTVVQSIVVVAFLVIKAFAIQHTILLIVAYSLVYTNVLTLLLSGVGYIRQGLQRLEGYGLVYLFAGIFICLFIVMLNYMIADGVILWQKFHHTLYPSLYRI